MQSRLFNSNIRQFDNYQRGGKQRRSYRGNYHKNHSPKIFKEYVPQTQEIQLKEPTYRKIISIKPGKNAYNVYGKIINCQIKEQKKKDKTKIMVAQGQIADETAVIDFCISGNFADLMKENSVVCIRNGKSEIFQTRHRLEIDRWGKVTAEDDNLIQLINLDENLSKAQYDVKINSFQQ